MIAKCYCLVDETFLAEIVHGNMQENFVKTFVAS